MVVVVVVVVVVDWFQLPRTVVFLFTSLNTSWYLGKNLIRNVFYTNTYPSTPLDTEPAAVARYVAFLLRSNTSGFAALSGTTVNKEDIVM